MNVEPGRYLLSKIIYPQHWGKYESDLFLFSIVFSFNINQHMMFNQRDTGSYGVCIDHLLTRYIYPRCINIILMILLIYLIQKDKGKN